MVIHILGLMHRNLLADRRDTHVFIFCSMIYRVGMFLNHLLCFDHAILWSGDYI